MRCAERLLPACQHPHASTPSLQRAVYFPPVPPSFCSACESTFCGAHLPAFNALADVLEEAVGIRLPVDACEACILGVEGGS